MSGRSIVEFFSEHEGYKCGYCGSKDTNYSRGMWAHSLTVQDYQDLIDRGWRRSGKYVYKPTLKRTCCPQYPIRCDALNVKLNKSHKKVVKLVNRFLNEGVKRGAHSTDASSAHHGIEEEATNCQPESTAAKTANSEKEQQLQTINLKECKEKKQPKPGVGADPNKPPCKKAKERRMEKRKQKLEAASEETRNVEQNKEDLLNKKAEERKSLEDFLQEISDNPAHKLEMRLIQSAPQSEEFKKSLEESYTVYKKYQMSIHRDSPEECDMETYLNFLVRSPLQPVSGSDTFGSFHQQYVLDGRIIAVGVIDILPSSISSVYLYYDPDVSFLSLGTYSALRELALTRQLHSKVPSIKYYYMGFYIHSCPKMKYKGQYYPSFLVCPESYKWIPIEQCSPKLDASRYTRFSEPEAVDSDGDIDLSRVLVLFHHQAMPYMIYQALSEDADDEEEVSHYAKLTGRTCAERMLLYRS